MYEKKIEAQLDASLDKLRAEIPQDPKWGIKKNSEGKNVFWYGYKGHLAVCTSSQYVLQSLFSSGFREHSYRYDSFDPTYETLKYTRPKECIDCPLANEGICQKGYKVKIRKYTAPARGSKTWKNIYKRRTAVERVNAYLKEFFQLKNVRYRTGKRAKIHFDMVVLMYNASKLAADRINAQFVQQQTA